MIYRPSLQYCGTIRWPSIIFCNNRTPAVRCPLFFVIMLLTKGLKAENVY